MPARQLLLTAVLVLFALPALAQDRDTKVRNDKKRFADDESWIYNDLAKGIEIAKKERKPLLVIFRCIPCEACALFDEQVSRREPQIKALLDKYICVRIPQGNAMDLTRFQFDYDLSFTAFLMNPDYTIYGRFGTRSSHDDSEKDISLEGFAKALSAGLELHANYPENHAQLAGKQPRQVKIKRPEDYPSLAGKYKDKIDYENKTAQSCLHCHQIRDAERLTYRTQKQPMPDQVLYPYPMPDTVGLALDRLEKAVVKSVAAGSAASQAGFQKGDEILTLAGQPMLSIADVQWVLHHAGDSDTLAAEVKRGGKTQKLSLKLEPGWRKKSDISWRTTTWDLRRMGLGGLLLESLPAADRKSAGLEDNALALRVRHVGQYGEHAVAMRAGFKQGDVVVAFDGKSTPMSETDLLAVAVQKRMPGEKVPVTVLRGGKRIEMQLALQ
jgi:serine protease Do